MFRSSIAVNPFLSLISWSGSDALASIELSSSWEYRNSAAACAYFESQDTE